MSDDKLTCKNVPIKGQANPNAIKNEGNLLEFNTKLQKKMKIYHHLNLYSW